MCLSFCPAPSHPLFWLLSFSLLDGEEEGLLCLRALTWRVGPHSGSRHSLLRSACRGAPLTLASAEASFSLGWQSLDYLTPSVVWKAEDFRQFFFLCAWDTLVLGGEIGESRCSQEENSHVHSKWILWPRGEKMFMNRRALFFKIYCQVHSFYMRAFQGAGCRKAKCKKISVTL